MTETTVVAITEEEKTSTKAKQSQIYDGRCSRKITEKTLIVCLKMKGAKKEVYLSEEAKTTYPFKPERERSQWTSH